MSTKDFRRVTGTAARIRRPLGTMVVYGFARGHLATDLGIAGRLGATLLEALPDWRAFPDPGEFRRQIDGSGFRLHSAHGCWGGQTIRADRVDLGEPEPARRLSAVDDIRRCLDWLAAAGGRHLVVHPGGYSQPETTAARGEALALSLRELAEHIGPADLIVCVENMPSGVHPGSRMADLAAIVAELDDPRVGLALDTGHAHIVGDPAGETLAAGSWLRTTHVHDNNGRQDTHEPPGGGSLDWIGWRTALDRIDYRGPIMLECIRKLREVPSRIDEEFLAILDRLTAGEIAAEL